MTLVSLILESPHPANGGRRQSLILTSTTEAQVQTRILMMAPGVSGDPNLATTARSTKWGITAALTPVSSLGAVTYRHHHARNLRSKCDQTMFHLFIYYVFT